MKGVFNHLHDCIYLLNEWKEHDHVSSDVFHLMVWNWFKSEQQEDPAPNSSWSCWCFCSAWSYWPSAQVGFSFNKIIRNYIWFLLVFIVICILIWLLLVNDKIFFSFEFFSIIKLIRMQRCKLICMCVQLNMLINI